MKPGPEIHHYTESGLRNVWLANGYKVLKTAYGQGVSFGNLEGLHREIGRWLCAYRPRLAGAEFRFLRHELDLSQAALAARRGNDAQSVALWENSKVRVPAWGTVSCARSTANTPEATSKSES
jgi:DNA-binding transcriptional regulator YiaG